MWSVVCDVWCGVVRCMCNVAECVSGMWCVMCGVVLYGVCVMQQSVCVVLLYDVVVWCV